MYLATDDITKTVEAAAADGAEDHGRADARRRPRHQAVLIDPTGADLGAWQPGTFPGFTVLERARRAQLVRAATRLLRAVAFYRSVFGWETDAVGDSDEFRYTTMRNPGGEGELAGIMDASALLPDGVPAHWSVYWEVDDVDATVAKVKTLGGSVVIGRRGHPLRPPGHGRPTRRENRRAVRRQVAVSSPSTGPAAPCAIAPMRR